MSAVPFDGLDGDEAGGEGRGLSVGGEHRLELIYHGGDLAGVGVVLVAAGDPSLRRPLSLDYGLRVEPVVVLRLERLREARKGLAAEHVRKEVTACEADVHLAVVKPDVERVAVGRAAHDGDLPAHGRLPLEEVVRERGVCDMIYCDSHGFSPSCFLCPVYTPRGRRLHGNEFSGENSKNGDMRSLFHNGSFIWE